MIKLARDDDLQVQLNNTSMTDVIFIFLIFFISLSQIRTGTVDVDLPTVGRGAEARAAEGSRTVIEVSRDGGVFLDGEKVEPGALAARIAALRGDGGDGPRIRIRSDEASRSGLLVEVIAAVAEAGVKEVEFAVKVGS